jgi:hypothetical protein
MQDIKYWPELNWPAIKRLADTAEIAEWEIDGTDDERMTASLVSRVRSHACDADGTVRDLQHLNGGRPARHEIAQLRRELADTAVAAMVALCRLTGSERGAEAEISCRIYDSEMALALQDK